MRIAPAAPYRSLRIHHSVRESIKACGVLRALETAEAARHQASHVHDPRLPALRQPSLQLPVCHSQTSSQLRVTAMPNRIRPRHMCELVTHAGAA